MYMRMLHMKAMHRIQDCFRSEHPDFKSTLQDKHFSMRLSRRWFSGFILTPLNDFKYDLTNVFLFLFFNTFTHILKVSDELILYL